MKLSAADLAFLNAQTLFGAAPPPGTDPFSTSGLRMVDGTFNNISGVTAADGFVDQFGTLIDTAKFGTVNQAFTHQTPRHFRVNYTQGVGAAGNVTDSSPRIISNLVADQTATNPAFLTATAAGTIVNHGDPTVFITPFSSWFTIFGQFFDHGLDFIAKGGNGTVTIPLPPGDPLLAFGPPGAMFLTRATVDANGENTNTTAPFVDQSQTYGSDKTIAFYVHEYDVNGLETGRLVTHADGGMATWADIKANALKVGIVLTDADVNNAPIPVAGATPTTWTRGGPSGQMFLADIAGTANPYTSGGVLKTQDTDGVIGTTNPVEAANPLVYDNELLNAHKVAGDPRANENIALTAIHEVFHNEHNRLVDVIKNMITQQDQIAPGFAASWDGARIFEAAKVVNEMQYQHLVFEEFARRMSPNIDAFASYNPALNPNITTEFSQAIFRLGHSMLTDTVHMTDAAGGATDMTLINAFLNPVAFDATSAADLAQGMSQQTGNEIDEFVVDSVRNFLVGLPLDLAALNIARGRDVGLGSLNQVRADLFAQTGEVSLTPYTSWADYGANLLHPESLVNFIAAYSNDAGITAARNAGDNTLARSLATTAMANSAFMNGGDTGFNNVDLWIGGLAEQKVLNGGISPGMLGSTFDFIFATQMLALQNADRLYYLARLGGTNILTEIDGQTFGDIVERATGVTHTNGDIFGTADHYIELSSLADHNTAGVNVAPDGTLTVTDFTKTAAQANTVLHEVIGGTNLANNINGGAGNDTLWGEQGNDTLRGGLGNDHIYGGDGNDTLTDTGGDDFLRGDAGNDTMNGGIGLDIMSGGTGNDTMDGGDGADELFGNFGDDTMRGGNQDDALEGNEGNDNMDGGAGADKLDGGIGNDVLKGGAGDDNLAGADDDDYLVGGGGADLLDGGIGGHDIASYENSLVGLRIDMAGTFLGTGDARGDTFLDIEEVRGSAFNDQIFGDLANNTLVGGGGTDQLDGRDGNDTLIGGTGDDQLVGGLGTDIAVFSGLRADYNFSIATPSVITDINLGDGNDGTDSLSGIEFLQFSDQIISTATGQVAAPKIALTNSTPVVLNGTPVFDNVENTLVVNDGTALTGTGLTVATIQIAEPGVSPVISGTRVFTLAGPDGGSFSVVPDGLGGNVLKLIGGGPTSFVNFEAKQDYHVTLTVTDNLGTDSINYTLNVTDVNDNRATITSGADANVQENINTNVVVYRVAGTDQDTVGPALAFSLVAGVGGEDNARFTIANNGEIHFAASPNFEAPLDANADNIYNILVGVSDGVGVPTTKAVQIHVSNIAEGGPNVAPTINSNGGGATASVAINENLTGVTVVTATDPDLPAQPLSYSIIGGADAAAFTINPTSGTLSFLAAPNFEAPTDVGADNIYNVTVQVSDGAGGLDSQAIAVTVNNVVVEGPVNTPPVITSGGGGATAVASIAENLTAVTTITATDSDVPAQPLTFSITGGADAVAFNINPTTGALAFNTAPNFEAPTDAGLNNVYDVNVQVSDGAGGIDTQAIAVTVTNVFPETITGDNNANVLNGTADADIILGLGGDDTIHGNGGDDTITGGLGKDTMFGDAGANTFVFNSVTETPTGSANRDVIGDFVHLTDTMDLTAIDAKTGVAGNQAFIWISTQAFHNVKGELHYAQTNNPGTANDFTIVSGDTNGDGVADFQIELTGLVTVNVSDFNL